MGKLRQTTKLRGNERERRSRTHLGLSIHGEEGYVGCSSLVAIGACHQCRSGEEGVGVEGAGKKGAREEGAIMEPWLLIAHHEKESKTKKDRPQKRKEHRKGGDQTRKMTCSYYMAKC